MWHNNVFFNPTSDLWCHLFCRMTWKQINAPEKMKENQPAKQDPSLEAIFKWMYVVIVDSATNWIIALSRAKHNPSVWIFYFSQKETDKCVS